MKSSRRKILFGCAIAVTLGAVVIAPSARAQSDSDAARWQDLSAAIFPERALHDGAALMTIDAPTRAEDAAVVPISVHFTLPPGDARHVSAMKLVIDANPSPVAATFTFADGTGTDQVATRIRVDDYTYVHAVAELSDGELYVAQRYVKAAGGCSAPAAKSVASDGWPVGALRVRLRRPEGGTDPSIRDAQIMVHHPNFSGMQMDQVTRMYVPAFFVHRVEVSQGGHLVIGIESGISISENPEYRFDYRPQGDGRLHVQVVDSEQASYATDYVPPPS